MFKSALVVAPLALSSLQMWLWPSDFDVNRKVFFQPPGYVFGIVWTTLYLMLGGYVYRLVEKSGKDRYKVTMLALFVVNMVINLLWTPTVNSLRKFTWGIYMIGVMILTGMLLMALETDRTSRALLAPYLVWLLFALSLNIELARMYIGTAAK